MIYHRGERRGTQRIGLKTLCSPGLLWLNPVVFTACVGSIRPQQISLDFLIVSIRGVNDDQIGDILWFASGNLDVVKGVNMQPVSFAGRINQEDREKWRFTIPDAFKCIEEQTGGEITRDDFYPVSIRGSDIVLWRSQEGGAAGEVHDASALRCRNLCLCGKW